MPFSTAQTHCWAVLNFREWHLSSKSWSTCLLPKITTVQGYFSYNSSGSWLSLLLRNCLHITLPIRLPPKSTLQGCLVSNCAFIWQRKPAFDLYLLPPFYLRRNSEILVGPGLFLQSQRFFLKIFHDSLPLEKWEIALILGSAKWRDFWRLWEVAMLWICKLPKNVIS